MESSNFFSLYSTVNPFLEALMIFLASSKAHTFDKVHSDFVCVMQPLETIIKTQNPQLCKHKYYVIWYENPILKAFCTLDNL